MPVLPFTWQRHNFGRVLWPYAVECVHVHYSDKFKYVTVCKHSNRLLQILCRRFKTHSLYGILSLSRSLFTIYLSCSPWCTLFDAHNAFSMCFNCASIRSLIAGNMKITNVHTARTLSALFAFNNNTSKPTKDMANSNTSVDISLYLSFTLVPIFLFPSLFASLFLCLSSFFYAKVSS